jgi:hypothetical protein
MRQNSKARIDPEYPKTVEEDNTDFIANERLAIMNASLQEC